MHLGLPEIIAVLLIILLLFGPGRIEKLASEMGKGIRSFRNGIQGKKGEEGGEETPDAEPMAEPVPVKAGESPVEKPKKKKKKKDKKDKK